MGNTFTLIIASLAIAGCSIDAEEPVAESRAPIAGGVLDIHDDAVVGVVITDDSGYPKRSCTGTLIAPNLVLTAQHCVAYTNKFVDCARSVFGPAATPDLVRVTASPALWRSGVTWTGAEAVIVPPGNDSVCGRDVALVVLKHPLPGLVRPLHPRLDDGVRPSETYTAIGFGASDGDGDGAGVRRRRDELRVVCVGDDCDTHQVDDGEWRGDHGICNGDSGGPAIDASGAVIGVTSRGPKGCERPIYGALAAHAPWIRDGARMAAQAGGYDAPAWVSEAQSPVIPDPSFAPPARVGACAAAPSEARDGWWPLLSVVGIAACFRRRRH